MQLDNATIHALGQPNVGLDRLIRGIEKESLRVNPDGSLSQLPHPTALGSALTHRAITTDFSEAQLELIPGTHPSPEGVLGELSDIHAFVQQNLGNDLITNRIQVSAANPTMMKSMRPSPLIRLSY